MMQEGGARVLRRTLAQDHCGRIRRWLAEPHDLLGGGREFGRGEEKLFSQLSALRGRKFRIGHAQQRLQLLRHFPRLGSALIRGDGDSEPSERAGEVASEHHLQVQPARGDGFRRNEHRAVRLAHAAGAAPARLRIAIGRGLGAGSAAEIVFGVALRSFRELHPLAVRADLKFAEEKIALRSLVISQARPVRGQTIIGQSFEAEGRDARGGVGEGEIVGVAFGDVAAGEDR